MRRALNGGGEPTPERTLSSTGVQLVATIPAGKLSVDVSIPTVVDRVTEPAEYFQAQLTAFDRRTSQPVPGPVITGTVTDN